MGTDLWGCWRPETPCAVLSVRLNYSIKCEAAPTYQIINELNYSSLSNHNFQSDSQSCDFRMQLQKTEGAGVSINATALRQLQEM